jgi:hypothetical protein
MLMEEEEVKCYILAVLSECPEEGCDFLNLLQETKGRCGQEKGLCPHTCELERIIAKLETKKEIIKTNKKIKLASKG